MARLGFELGELTRGADVSASLALLQLKRLATVCDLILATFSSDDVDGSQARRWDRSRAVKIDTSFSFRPGLE